MALLACGPAYAQDVPPVSSLSRPGGLALIGSERIHAELRGLEAAGDPIVNATAIKGEAILTAPFRLRREGRLAADIATSFNRMSAGAPVVYREFKPGNVDQSEVIKAWCGPGEQRTMFGWSAGLTVCMVPTADGKANLGVPSLHYGSWWNIRDITFNSTESRAERVEVLPAETPSTFNLVLNYERLRDEGVAIRGQIEGPGMKTDARSRTSIQRRILPLKDGVASLSYDGLHISLTPQANGDSVSVVAERVSSPFDFDAFGGQMTALVDGKVVADVEDEDKALAPTPFVIGAVKLNPANMTVGQGVMERGGVLLSGTAEYAATGRLTKPLNLRSPPLVNDTAAAGAILHEVEFARTTPLGTRTMTRIWCGPIGAPTVWSRTPVTMCLRPGQRYDLEAFWPSTGRPWLGTTANSGALVGLEAVGFEIDRSEASLLDSLGFRLEVQRVTDKEAVVRAFARKGNEDALILVITSGFEDGVATIPLWSHRLVLTRSDKGVTAQLSADGNGDGPTPGNLYP